MNKMTKIIALAMAGTMALGLTSCGSNGGSSSSGSSNSGSSNNGVVTLKWVTVGGGQPNNYDAWLKQINPYLEHPAQRSGQHRQRLRYSLHQR